MQSTISIEIDAPARLVFDLARDVERWPRLLPHYLDVRVLDRAADGVVTARMTAMRLLVPWLGYGLPVAWRARTWAEEDGLRLRFVHVGGATSGMDVTWRIDPTGERGCRVSIEHLFEPARPEWATLIDALFVRPIAGRTLATFKAIAEAVTESSTSRGKTPPASKRRAKANKST